MSPFDLSYLRTIVTSLSAVVEGSKVNFKEGVIVGNLTKGLRVGDTWKVLTGKVILSGVGTNCNTVVSSEHSYLLAKNTHDSADYYTGLLTLNYI